MSGTLALVRRAAVHKPLGLQSRTDRQVLAGRKARTNHTCAGSFCSSHTCEEMTSTVFQEGFPDGELLAIKIPGRISRGKDQYRGEKYRVLAYGGVGYLRRALCTRRYLASRPRSGLRALCTAARAIERERVDRHPRPIDHMHPNFENPSSQISGYQL